MYVDVSLLLIHPINEFEKIQCTSFIYLKLYKTN